MASDNGQSSMVLHWQAASRYSARVGIQLSAKGIDVPRALVDFPIGEDFARINPRKLIPVLEVDGRYLPEANVICEYFEDLGKGPSLRPDDLFDRARMRLIIRNYELYCDPHYVALMSRIAAGERDGPDIDAVIAKLQDELDELAGHLDGGGYAVGGALTLADCALGPPFLQMSLLFPALGRVSPVEANPALRSYFAGVRKDPHVAAGLDAMIEPFSQGITSWLGVEKA